MAKKIVTFLLVAVSVMAASPGRAQVTRQLPVVNVAIVADGPSTRVAHLRTLFLEEMRAVNRGEFDIRAPADLQLDGDRTVSGVRAAFDKALTDPRTDLVVALGVLGSHLAAQRTHLPKPVVAPLISNHGLADLPYKNGTSGRHNLSYVSLDVDIRRDLTAFLAQLMETLRTLGIRRTSSIFRSSGSQQP